MVFPNLRIFFEAWISFSQFWETSSLDLQFLL